MFYAPYNMKKIKRDNVQFISISRLNGSLHFHLRPINLVIFQEIGRSYRATRDTSLKLKIQSVKCKVLSVVRYAHDLFYINSKSRSDT
jgi:hypothetical protein